MKQPEFVWSRLYLPRPLDASVALSLLLVLASDRRSTPLVFEAGSSRSAEHGKPEVALLLGCPAEAVHRLRRTFADHIPASELFAAAPRIEPHEVGRLELRPPVLPLRIDQAEITTRALLSVLAMPVGADEGLVVQVCLGSRRGPRPVPVKAPKPDAHLLSALLRGQEHASTEQRAQLRIRAEDAGFDAVVRVGSRGFDPSRTRRMTLALHSALATATSPGVQMSFVREPASRLVVPSLHRGRVELACAELLGLLAWPLGNGELPGTPPIHPVLIKPSTKIHTVGRVFAQSLTPGDGRQVGISPADALMHTVFIGPTGVGKTTAIEHLLAYDIRAELPVAVIDPKKQLADRALSFVPESRLDSVVVLDPLVEPVIGFNPLDAAGRDPDVVADGVLAVLAHVFRDGWGPRTSDIFSAALRTAIRAGSRTGTPATLEDIPRMLTDPSFARPRISAVSDDETLARFWAMHYSQSVKAQMSVVAPVLSRLGRLLARPSVRRLLSDSSGRFRVRDMWQDRLIVVAHLNEGLLGPGTVDLIGNLLLSELHLSIQERAAEVAPAKRPGVIYVDEAPRFIGLSQSIGDALATSRSLGGAWVLGSQAMHMFGSLRADVETNARSKIVMSPDYDDSVRFARGDQVLKPVDFAELGRAGGYKAYANLVAEGHPQGWALVQTLPPLEPVADPEKVAAHSRQRWAAPNAEPSAPPESGAVSKPAGGFEGASTQAPVGRKMRAASTSSDAERETERDPLKAGHSGSVAEGPRRSETEFGQIDSTRDEHRNEQRDEQKAEQLRREGE